MNLEQIVSTSSWSSTRSELFPGAKYSNLTASPSSPPPSHRLWPHCEGWGRGRPPAHQAASAGRPALRRGGTGSSICGAPSNFQSFVVPHLQASLGRSPVVRGENTWWSRCPPCSSRATLRWTCGRDFSSVSLLLLSWVLCSARISLVLSECYRWSFFVKLSNCGVNFFLFWTNNEGQHGSQWLFNLVLIILCLVDMEGQ